MTGTRYHAGMPEKNNSRADDPLAHMLERSDALHDQLNALLEGAEFDDSPRSGATLVMLQVAMEHAIGLRALMTLGLPTSAASLMRLQFEALTRAMWLLYAASDVAIDKLQVPLTLESE